MHIPKMPSLFPELKSEKMIKRSSTIMWVYFTDDESVKSSRSYDYIQTISQVWFVFEIKNV